MPNNVLIGLHSKITEFSHATLVTSESCGSLRTAQIVNPHLDTDGRIWCFLSTNSFVVANIESCPDALLLWPHTIMPISVSATGFVITNRKIKQSILARTDWSGAQIDPLSSDVVLICLTVKRIEYWDEQLHRYVCHVIPKRLIKTVTNAIPAHYQPGISARSEQL